MRWTVLLALLVAACTSSSADPGTSNAPTSTIAPGSSSVATGGTTDVGDGPTGSNPVTAASETASPEVRPDGFGSTLARTTMPDGTMCEFCVWVADTPQQRSRGLMFVTDLGAADAMAFLYPAARTGTFWMKNTVLPLSIAFFAPDGAFLASFDMEPCRADPCPNYRTAEGFQIAVEVPQGDLAEFGLVEGSTFELLDLPCTT